MKNTKLSSIKTCTLAAVIILVVCLPTTSPTQTMGDHKSAAAGEWKTVEDVFGFPGANLPGGVVRFNMPRKDLHVTLAGTEIKPGLALGAWAAFHHVGDNDAMVMGDLVLTEDEVAPVMKALLDGGIEVTAIHNHLIGESPKIIYIHMGGHGDPVKMAQTITQAVRLTKTPLPQGDGAKETADLGFDVAAVEKILGRQGNVSGGVLALQRATRGEAHRRGHGYATLEGGRHRHQFPTHRKWACSDSWGFRNDGERGWSRYEGSARQRPSSSRSAQPCAG